MKKLKLRIIAFSISLCLIPTVSFAVVPIAYFAAWSLIGHLAIADGYLAYLAYNLMSGNKQVSSGGDVAAPSTVTWVDLTDPTTPAIKTKDVAVIVGRSEIEQKVNGSPSSYPNLKAALDSSSSGSSNPTPPLTNGTVIAVQGERVSVYQEFRSPSAGFATTQFGEPPLNTYFVKPSDLSYSGFPVYYATESKFDYMDGDRPVYSFKGYVYFATKLPPAGLNSVISNADGSLKSEYDEEISRLIKSSTVQNGDVIDIKMGNGWPSGSTFTEPAPPTSAQIEAAGGVGPNGGGLVSDGSTSSNSGSGGSGTIPEFTTAPFASDKPYGQVGGGSGQQPQFNFGGRFSTFVDQMKNTSLFSLPSNFLTKLPTDGDSSISFDGGMYGSHTFDFTSMSSVFNTVRSIFLVVFGWLSIRIVSLRGGGG